MIDFCEAKRIATEIVRHKLDRGATRSSIRETVFEGGYLFWAPKFQYLIRAGKVIVAEHMLWPLRGDEYAFRVDDLLLDMDSPQRSLFA